LKITENFNKFNGSFGGISFDGLSLEKTIDTLKSKGDLFHDVCFVPCKQNVYGSTQENTLDVYPHWRRPAEFMKPDF